MDNPERLAALDTQDRGQRQAKHKNKTQKTKKMSNKDTIKKPGMNSGAHDRSAVPVSINTPAQSWHIKIPYSNPPLIRLLSFYQARLQMYY